MDKINNFYLIIIINFISICEINNYKIGSQCGFPGLPHNTKIEPFKRVYNDGEEVTYRCPKDSIYLKTQTKKCEAGVWRGNRSTCGYFLRNPIKYVKVVNEMTGQIVYEGNTSNCTSEEYPAAFYDNSATRVTLLKAQTRYKWYLNYSKPMLFDFFLLNLRIPASHQELSNQIDAIRVKNVEIINEPNRVCTLDFSTRDRAAKIFWFWCSVNSSVVSTQPVFISFTTRAPKPIDIIGLHQVYMTKLQYCGQPALPLLTQYKSTDNGYEEVYCDENIAINADPIDKNENEMSAAVRYDSEDLYMSCDDDQYWAGNPKCLPKLFCDLDLNDLDVEIVSVQNAYIFNETKWYAIEGTKVEYKCKNALMTTREKQCLNNQTWNQIGSVCHEMDNESNKNSTLLLIMAIIIIIIMMAIIAIIIIKRRKLFDYNKRDKRELSDMPKPVSYDDITEYMDEKYEEPVYSSDYQTENVYETNFSYRDIITKPYYLGVKHENNAKAAYLPTF